MRTRRKDISHTHLPVHVKFHLNVLSLGFKRINSLGPFNLHNKFLHGQLFLYLFLSTFGNLSVDFLLPCICLLASEFSSWAALHNGSWVRAAGGVLPWGLSGMGRMCTTPCHYGHVLGSSVCPDKGGPRGGSPWGWGRRDLRMWMASQLLMPFSPGSSVPSHFAF